jgi:hypothetical protein
MGSLKDFLQKIPSIAVPEKLTLTTLYALGYKSTNDRPIVKILKFIKFLNEDGTPTDNYRNFRSKEKAKSVMADCLRSAYKDLFGLYPDAYKRSEEELRDFFSTRVTGGELVLSLTVKTFKTLCEFADFEAPTEAVPPRAPLPVPMKAPSVTEVQIPQLVLNLNIQLQLPATENAEVYEKIFKALRECLIVRG